jgi:hypothetical protein
LLGLLRHLANAFDSRPSSTRDILPIAGALFKPITEFVPDYGSLPMMPALMETRAPAPPGSRFGRMIPQLARRSTNVGSSRDTNTPAANSSLTAEELKALDVESSKVIDLEKFVPRNDIDPVYFDSSYYLHPDGPIAVETLRVIGAAMAEAGVVGLGRLTLSRRSTEVRLQRPGHSRFARRGCSDRASRERRRGGPRFESR